MKRHSSKSSAGILGGILLAGLCAAAGASDTLFQASLRLLDPITLTTSQGLDFGAITAGQTQDVIIPPAAGARFTGTGEPLAPVTGSMVESQLTLTTGDGSQAEQRITVDSFTLGGEMDASGSASFDGAGQLNNLRVGATAHVDAANIIGAYQGNATFRLLYQ